MIPSTLFNGLPAEDLVTQGLRDLGPPVMLTPEALLVCMARTKLLGLGVPVPPQAYDIEDAELKLYDLLCDSHEDAYGEYNALRRRLGRFERALEARVSRLRALR